MTDLYREADCEHTGWRATESGHPQCLDCGGLERYVISVEPCQHQHITAFREIYRDGEFQGIDFDECDVSGWKANRTLAQIYPPIDLAEGNTI